MYVDANKWYGWAMSKKLPVDGFKWVDDLSMITEDFIKSYDEEGDVGYLLAVDIEYPKTVRMIYLFCLIERKLIKLKSLFFNATDKENYSIHIVALK